MPKERRIYKNPPIVEALCEFRFTPAEFDLSFPSRLYDLLKEDYPDKPVVRREAVQSHVAVGLGPNQTVMNKLQFSTDSNRRLVVTGPNTLSIHDLQPYSGWEGFSKRINKAFGAYRSIANVSVFWVTVRYLNAIRLKPDQNNLRDYFTFLPPKLDGVPDHAKAFLVNAQLGFPEEPYTTVITFTQSPNPGPKDAGLTLLLDIGCVWQTQSEGLSDLILEPGSKVAEVVKNLRECERDVFEGLITDKLRAQFDE